MKQGRYPGKVIVEDSRGAKTEKDYTLEVTGNDDDSQGYPTEPTGTSQDTGNELQVPIDSTGSRTSVSLVKVNGIDYAMVGVMYADSPDSPPDAAGSELPREITIDLESLGLKNVEKVYMATQSAWSSDLPNGVKVCELVFDYEEEGPPTTLDLIMCENIAEWSWENPAMARYFGGRPPHSMPPILISNTASDTVSNEEFQAHSYAADVNLDPARTLSRIRLNVVDANLLKSYRSALNSESTWIGIAIMAVTLCGSKGEEAVSLILNQDIAGEWSWFTGDTVYISQDGKVESNKNGIKTNQGTWVDLGNGSYKLNWEKGGWLDTLTLSRDGLSLDGYNQQNTPVRGVRTLPSKEGGL